MSDEKAFIRNALEASIRIGILVVLAAWCFSIVKPFIIPIAWGVIIAVATYPTYLKGQRILGGRGSVAAALIVILGLVLIITPTLMLSSTLIESGQGLAKGFLDGKIAVPPPPATVKDWPVIGGSADSIWRQASENLTAVLTKIAPTLKTVGVWLLESVAGIGLGILQFVVAIIIAGFLLAGSEAGGKAARAIATRLVGDDGAEFAKLAEATVRSVTRGILGVSIIQSLLAGLGFLVMGIAGAGLWALLCLLLSVIQIGIFPITLPIVLYVFSTAETAPAVMFLIWSLFVGTLDNILKPIWLGRGVEVPMAVIFIGAIGGFMSSGIIGLFVGSVILVLGYKLFIAWLNKTPEPQTAPPSTNEETGQGIN